MRLISSLLALATLATLAACSDKIVTPSMVDVAGSYHATMFTTSDNTGTTDQLARGATFVIVLAVNGTTTGRLFVPGAGSGGSDFDADLTGTWTLNGATVEFAQDADTFVRDVAFVADHSRLTAEQAFSGVTIGVVLTK